MGIRPQNLAKAIKWIFRARSNETTADSKVLIVQNSTGVNMAYVDIEGDITTVGNVAATGNVAASGRMTAVNFVASSNVVANTIVCNLSAGSTNFVATSNVIANTVVANVSCNAVTVNTAALIASANAQIGPATTVAPASGTLATVKGITSFTTGAVSPAQITANNAVINVVTATGLAPGDVVLLATTNVAINAGLSIHSRANTNGIDIVFENNSSVAIDRATATYTFLVIDLT